MDKKKLEYPQPVDELKKIANDIFTPVKRHLCIACFFISGTGKRVYFKFIIKEEKILSDIFGNAYEKTLFVYVDPDEIIEENNESYLRLVNDSLIRVLSRKKLIKYMKNKQDNPLFNIKETLHDLINDGWHTVFILNDFEFTLRLSPSIFRNLESILAMNKSLVSFMFLATENLLDPLVLDKFHNLKYAINRTTYYYPMMNENQVNFLLGKISGKIGLKITDAIRESLTKLCNGHAQLLKYSLTLLKQLDEKQLKSKELIEKYLLENDQLKTVCNDIWNLLSLKEQEIITQVVKTEELKDENSVNTQYLLKTRIILKKGNKYEVFCEHFRNFVKSIFPKENLIYDESTKQIYYGNSSCTNNFTLQEFKLLVYFINNEEKVISRDEIGQILWGSNYVEKFSDWSIDKIISTIRKKLKEIGFPPHNLITLKRRGFSFKNGF